MYLKMQEDKKLQEEIIRIVRYHYPDAKDIIGLGSRVGGWQRDISDYDVGVYGTEDRTCRYLRYRGQALNITPKEFTPQEIWMGKFLLPRFSLITEKLDSVSRTSIELYLKWRQQHPESKWTEGRDFSKIIGESRCQ